MGMTSAERQRRYRERHLKNPDAQGERINIVVTKQAKAALTSLASNWRATEKAALERALIKSQAALQSNEPLQGNEASAPSPLQRNKIERLRGTVAQMLQAEDALHKEIRELRAHLKNRDAEIEHQKTMRAMVERERELALAEVSRLKSTTPASAPSPLPRNEPPEGDKPLPSNTPAPPQKTAAAERDAAIREAKAARPDASNYTLAREFDTSEATVRRALKG